jgi:hypothetical protein
VFGVSTVQSINLGALANVVNLKGIMSAMHTRKLLQYCRGKSLRDPGFPDRSGAICRFLFLGRTTPSAFFRLYNPQDLPITKARLLVSSAVVRRSGRVRVLQAEDLSRQAAVDPALIWSEPVHEQTSISGGRICFRLAHLWPAWHIAKRVK